MKSVLTLVETVEIAWEMKKPKFWTFSIGYLSLYPFFYHTLRKKSIRTNSLVHIVNLK